MELPKTTFSVTLGASTVYVAGGGGVNCRPNPNLTLDLSPESSSVLLRDSGVNDIPAHLSHSHLNGELAQGQGLAQPSVTLYGNSMGDNSNALDQGQGLGQRQGLAQGLAQGVVIAQPVRHWLFVEHHVGDLQGTLYYTIPAILYCTILYYAIYSCMQPVRHWLFVEHHVGDLQGARPSPPPLVR